MKEMFIKGMGHIPDPDSPVADTNDPYRAASGIDEEVRFWDAAFLAALSCMGIGTNAAAEAADNAVKLRRERFGKR